MSIEELYEAYRKPLISYAYRMLGSVMDAEDIVQEAFISYGRLEEPDAIRNERSFLYKIVTNRCLDLLRSSAKKRELYVGPWLPEPLMGLLDAAEADPSEIYMRRESISTAYLLLLQQLSAVERAVFLLREIFHYSFDEIAGMVGKSTANCRQIFHRAKKKHPGRS
ncbi:sigma-70 family RNA polymerase sigma factor [Paenibacillus sp. AR247]|uniref:sigma-70 family RNA polymerase sigma factor n=1 Tax=Paenibacillus sp. AR247 TaxID=1631599 RepID=UPI0026A1B49C|nr:sigma-70 family RNA polymerase sigma factor [Paenibacillus sp. AR247]